METDFDFYVFKVAQSLVFLWPQLFHTNRILSTDAKRQLRGSIFYQSTGLCEPVRSVPPISCWCWFVYHGAHRRIHLLDVPEDDGEEKYKWTINGKGHWRNRQTRMLCAVRKVRVIGEARRVVLIMLVIFNQSERKIYNSYFIIYIKVNFSFTQFFS